MTTFGPAGQVPAPPGIARVVREYTDVRTVPETGRRLAERIRQEVPYFREAPDSERDALDRRCTAHIRYLIGVTEFDSGGATVPTPLGPDRSQVGEPLTVILAALRAGANFVWEVVADHARNSPAMAAGEVVDLASDVWAMYGDLARGLERGWRETDREPRPGRRHGREELVADILRGTPSPAGLWEAVDQLGLPRRGSYVVVAAEKDDRPEDALATIESQLRHRQLGSAWSNLGAMTVGIVSVSAISAVDVLLAQLRDMKITAGVSPAHEKWTDAPKSFRLASAAVAASPESCVLRFEDAPVGVVVASAPDISWRVAQDVLGNLLKLSDDEQKVLLDTVEAWFLAEGSTVETARSLYLHPNTVRNRLRHVEQLTDRNLNAPMGAAEVAVALQAIRLR